MHFNCRPKTTCAKLSTFLVTALLAAVPVAKSDEIAVVPKGKQPSTDAAASLKSQNLTRQLRKMVVDSLKDPDSAKFKDVFLGYSEDPKSSVRSLCGFVNAKNSMGGYVGFKPFVANLEGVLSMGSEALYLVPVWCRGSTRTQGNSGGGNPKAEAKQAFPPAPDFNKEGITIPGGASAPSADWREQYRPKAD